MTRALRLLGIGTASAGETVPDPMSGAPAVGACYDLTYKQAGGDSTSEATVDCGGKHTLIVGAVGQLPESFDWDDSSERYTYSNKICKPFWHKYYVIGKPSSYLTLLYGVLAVVEVGLFVRYARAGAPEIPPESENEPEDRPLAFAY